MTLGKLVLGNKVYTLCNIVSFSVYNSGNIKSTYCELNCMMLLALKLQKFCSLISIAMSNARLQIKIGFTEESLVFEAYTCLFSSYAIFFLSFFVY